MSRPPSCRQHRWTWQTVLSHLQRAWQQVKGDLQYPINWLLGWDVSEKLFCYCFNPQLLYHAQFETTWFDACQRSSWCLVDNYNLTTKIACGQKDQTSLDNILNSFKQKEKVEEKFEKIVAYNISLNCKIL